MIAMYFIKTKYIMQNNNFHAVRVCEHCVETSKNIELLCKLYVVQLRN